MEPDLVLPPPVKVNSLSYLTSLEVATRPASAGSFNMQRRASSRLTPSSSSSGSSGRASMEGVQFVEYVNVNRAVWCLCVCVCVCVLKAQKVRTVLTLLACSFFLPQVRKRGWEPILLQGVYGGERVEAARAPLGSILGELARRRRRREW